MLHFSSKKFLLVSTFLVVTLTASAQIVDDPIKPSMIHGVCSMCSSTSCTNCGKCAPSALRGERRDPNICTLCTNVGGHCSEESFRLFEGQPGSRKTCHRNGTSACGLGCQPPISVFIPRSQGADTARELMGWEEFIYQYDVGGFYLTTGHVLGYSHSFRPERIARLLFGDTELHFAGSQVADRGRCEILADNFGLSATMRGTLFFHPTIENIIFDNQLFIGLDPLLCGLYARIHAPIVHTRWNLGMSQKLIAETCTPFPACYMGGDAKPTTCSIIDALSGQHTFGDMQQPWRFGRFSCGTQTKTGLADIDLILGYMPWQTDTYHLGFYSHVVAPTGNKLSGRFIFEPLVGNNKHWELGLGATGHLLLWEWTSDQSLALYAEGSVTHLFKNTQMRSFDFCHNGQLSRYLLLKQLERVDDTLNYAGSLINGINFATRPVEVSVAAKGDFSAKFCFRTPCLIFDLGYNFYGITREHISFKRCDDEKLYGIKGTEGVCGLEYATAGTTAPITFGDLVGTIPLNSTQHNATIRNSARTDNPVDPATAAPGDVVVTAFSRQQGPVEGPDVIPAKISRPPVLVNTACLHKLSGAMPAQATHKVFGYLGYNFYQYDWCYNPYLGLGGEIEFDARSRQERTALNQWSVWLKWGFEF